MLDVLYHDSDLVAVHKPPGLLVHRTKLDPRENAAALQLLRDQIGARVFPVHRLDRPTSGVLLFALNEQAARRMSDKFAAREVDKTYLCVTRGIPQRTSWMIDYPLVEELDALTDRLANEGKPAQDAITEVRCLDSVELPFRVDKFPTARYALLECRPKTGRKHQIRRHLRHEGHPIVGDVNHGVGKHNRFFSEHFGVRRLLLCCTEISFRHPSSNEAVWVRAALDPEVSTLFGKMGWSRHAPA